MTQTIEQLRAHSAELEEEKKELQALLDFDNARLDQIEDELEDVEYLGPYVEGIKVLKKQLAAVQEEMNDWRNQAHQSQSAFDRLQDQLAELKEENARLKAESRDARIVTMDLGGGVERALSLPAATEALDAYVAEKVKEAKL